MLRYCPSTASVYEARGSRPTTSATMPRTRSTCSSSFASSWSRAIIQSVAFDVAPVIRSGCTKPSRPSVVSGESPPRERGDHVRHELERVDEPPLRGSRMDADALDREQQLVGGERLRLELSEAGAVERVGDVGAERGEIEMVGSPSDLLVDREPDPGGRARAVVAEQPVGGRDDDRDPGLVVRPEERRSVARDEVVTELVGETGHVGRVEHLRRVAREHDRRASPGTVHDRGHPGARRGRRRVDVRDQPDRGRALHRARHRREHVAVLRELGVLEPDRTELVHQQPREVELPRGGRVRRRVGVGLRVDDDVAEKALEDLFGELLGERARVARVSQAGRADGGSRRSSRGPRGAPRPGCSRSGSGAAPRAA